MLRGLFTNRSVRNLLAPEIPPGSTVLPDGAVLPLWQAADLYRAQGVPVVIVAGERYGMGSSRDWAAKGAALLGTRAVLAVGFERIHRSNLIGMGILPLRLPDGVTPQSLALTARDRIELDLDPARLSPRAPVRVTLRRASGAVQTMDAAAAIETSLEVETLAQGGLMPLILDRVTQGADVPGGKS
jgi:aconitase (EC 4.2.1.3)